MEPRRILVPTDLTDPLLALEVASTLALPSHGEIVVMFVDSSLPSTAATFAPTPVDYDEAVRHEHHAVIAEVRRWMQAHVERKPGLHYRIVIRFGDPVHQIVHFVEHHAVDVMVLTSGRGVLGSVAHRLLQHPPCPVLVVRPKG